jgi:hypothetical protein
MFELLGVFVTVIAVAGVMLNNNHNKLCFKLWLISNSLSAGMHIYLLCYSLFFRDVIFIYLAWQGLKKWSKFQQFFKEKNKWQV